MIYKQLSRHLLVFSLTLGLGTFISSLSFAIQPTLVEVKPESDGTYTYVYKIKIDNTVLVKGGRDAPNPDFFTIFNFAGMVPGSEKQPTGWTFSTSSNGVTPIRGGRTVVSPVDVDGVPNLTWSRAGAEVAGATEMNGFSIRTTIKETMIGEYGAQVTRKEAGTLHPQTATESKESRIGSVTTPKLPKR